MERRLNQQGRYVKAPKALSGVAFAIIFTLLVSILPGSVGVVHALGPDDVEADVALLVVAGTNQVLLEKNADKVVEPASIAKIMTMLLALEAVEKGESALTDKIVVSPDAEAIGGSQVWLMGIPKAGVTLLCS